MRTLLDCYYLPCGCNWWGIRRWFVPVDVLLLWWLIWLSTLLLLLLLLLLFVCWLWWCGCCLICCDLSSDEATPPDPGTPVGDGSAPEPIVTAAETLRRALFPPVRPPPVSAIIKSRSLASGPRTPTPPQPPPLLLLFPSGPVKPSSSLSSSSASFVRVLSSSSPFSDGLYSRKKR